MSRAHYHGGGGVTRRDVYSAILFIAYLGKGGKPEHHSSLEAADSVLNSADNDGGIILAVHLS